MSADNWANCFNCRKNAEMQKERDEKAAASAYGKVTPGEYLALRARAERPLELSETLREDYEIGIDEDGAFSVNYRGGCDVCGVHFEFKTEERVASPPARAAKPKGGK